MLRNFFSKSSAARGRPGGNVRPGWSFRVYSSPLLRLGGVDRQDLDGHLRDRLGGRLRQQAGHGSLPWRAQGRSPFGRQQAGGPAELLALRTPEVRAGAWAEGSGAPGRTAGRRAVPERSARAGRWRFPRPGPGPCRGGTGRRRPPRSSSPPPGSGVDDREVPAGRERGLEAASRSSLFRMGFVLRNNSRSRASREESELRTTVSPGPRRSGP
jgi:hypothetical protein